jgi:broad specificity phosphatase PhoE
MEISNAPFTRATKLPSHAATPRRALATGGSDGPGRRYGKRTGAWSTHRETGAAGPGSAGTALDVPRGMRLANEGEWGAPLRLHLLRHGETEHSRQDRFCGRIDAPLTPEGWRMAEAFARRWAYHPTRPSWRAIYTSTRRRTVVMAAPFADAVRRTPVAEADLDEMDYGSWQGRSKQEIALEEPQRFRRWLADPTIGAPEGETGLEVARRALAFVERVREEHPRGGDVLIVGHKTWLRLLLCALIRVDLRLYRSCVPQPVSGHTVVEIEGGRRFLRQLGDLSYLPRDLRARAREPLPLARERSLPFAPETRGNLVGVQDAGGREAQLGFVDGEPASP